MEIQPLGRPSRRKDVAQSEKMSHIYSNPNPFTKIGCQMSGFLVCILTGMTKILKVAKKVLAKNNV